MARTVLIVDDDELIRRIVSEFLINGGFEIDELGDADDLLRHVRATSPDIILLDYHLPGVDGLTALKELRKHLVSIPVVMLTADNNQKVILQCFREGADDFVEKPFDADLLSIIVSRTLERRGVSLKDAVFMLLQYARHKDDCDHTSPGGCTCGMGDAVASAVDATRNVFPG